MTQQRQPQRQQALATQQDLAANLDEMALKIEQAIFKGDLNVLGAAERVVHYRNVCEALNLNPHTGPLQYISLNGKLVLYAGRQAAEQMCAANGISVREW